MNRFSIIVCLALVSLVASPAAAQAAQPCVSGVAANAMEGPAGGEPSCSAVARKIECDKKGGYLFTFTVTNNTGEPVTAVLVTPPAGSGISINPQMPPIPGGVLPNGQFVTLQVTITGGHPGQKICFPVTLMTKSRCCTIEVCVTLPNCCAEFNQQTIECKPNGSYSYTFTVTNKTPNFVQNIYLYAPAGTTITPSYFAVNLAPNATSAALTVTITGASPGRFCFGVSLHTEGMKTCCIFEQCIELPRCGTQTACDEGQCCSRPPRYDGTKFTGQKVAVVTGKLTPPKAPDHVVTVFDISGANAWGTNSATPPPGNQPPKYNGPAGGEWTSARLGSVFGVDIDHLGNIYVAASVAFGTDVQGPGGWGAVYRIDTGTGAIQTFAQLPNTPSGGQYPALGDVAFACPIKEFFVTNMDDGRIYRIDMGGAVLSTFDHATSTVASSGNPEPGDAPGVAPYGELLWAVQYHDGRVYYSVWNEDCSHPNALKSNEIWSVGFDGTGEFDPATRRLELKLPDLAGGNFSSPVSDLAFHNDGRMFAVERSMDNVTSVTAHSSRLLEFLCTPDGWRLSPPVTGFPYKYNVGEPLGGCVSGTAARPSNTAGGVDGDFDGNATWRVWATGDALQFFSSPVIYGFQGFTLAGGSKTTSPLLAVYGHGGFKTEIGDIEISCPPFGDLY